MAGGAGYRTAGAGRDPPQVSRQVGGSPLTFGILNFPGKNKIPIPIENFFGTATENTLPCRNYPN